MKPKRICFKNKSDILLMNLANSKLRRMSSWVKCALLARFRTTFGFLIEGIMKEILLSNGKTTMVNDEDYDFLNKWRWNFSGNYVLRHEWKNKKYAGTIIMHRLINKTPKGLVTDHIDGNTLNNQRTNLRSCTIVENVRNSKKQKNNKGEFKGVCYDKKRNKYESHIMLNGRKNHLGRYKTAIQAAVIYDFFAYKLFGVFANPNFKDNLFFIRGSA